MKKKSIILSIIIFILSYQIGLTQQNKSWIRKSGDILQIALPVAALGSTYFYQSDDKPHWQFLKAYAFSMLETQILKRLVVKQRPDGSDNLSFPSGHTASAFSGASFLQICYGWKVGWPAYLLASWVGYSRIYAHKHDIWDVLGGASISILNSLIFVKKYRSKNNNLSLVRYQHYFLVSYRISF